MSDLENAYLGAMRRVNDMRLDQEWSALLAREDPGGEEPQDEVPPAPPAEDNPAVITRFLEGVTKGMRKTPNVFRPMREGEDIIARTGEIPALPFNMAFNAVTEGLVEAGAISKRTQEQLGKTLVGAIPGLMGPKGPMKVGEVLKGGKRGEVRVTPGEPNPKAMESGVPKAADVAPEVTAPTPPPGEVRVNTSRIAAEDNIKTVIRNLNAMDAEKLSASRKPVSHERTIAGSKQISVEDALTLPEDTLTLPERVTRLRDIHATATTELTRLAEATKAGDTAAAGQLIDSFVVAGELDMRADVAKRNVARGLESMRIDAEGSRSPFALGELADLSEMLRGTEGGNPVVLAERLTAIGNTKRRVEYARNVVGFLKQNRDLAYTLYVNLLLTPASHAANVAGNTMMLLWAPVERAAAAALRPLTGGDVTMAEPVGMLRAVPEYFRAGLRAANDYFWNPTGVEKIDVTKAPPPTPASVYGMENTFVGRGVDFLWSNVLTLNTKLLGTADALFKPLNFHAEAKALAIREAVAEQLTGKAFTDRVRYIESHLDEFPSIVERANEFKLIQTFQDPMGPIGEGIDVVRQHVPGAKVVVPFLKTPNRIVYMAASNTFPSNLLFAAGGKIGRDLMGTPTQRQLAAGKLAAGTMASAAIATYAASGFITGAGPKDPSLRKLKEATGWKPYSIKVGDEYFGYNRMDPFGMQLGMIATAAEIIGQLPDKDADKLGMAMALAFSSNFVSKTYMQNLADILDAIDEPQSKGIKYLQNYGRTLTPGVVRTLKREADPVQRDAQNLLETFMANIPGYSETLPPVQNVWGDPQLVPEGWGPDWISPIAYSATKGDAVDHEVNRLKIDINMPPRFLFGARPPQMSMEDQKEAHGIPLTSAEYAYLVRLAGEPAKRDIAALITTKEYAEQSDGPEGGKAMLIKSIIGRHREIAKLKLLQEDEPLRQLVEEKTIRRALAVMPPKEVQRMGGEANVLRSLGR